MAAPTRSVQPLRDCLWDHEPSPAGVSRVRNGSKSIVVVHAEKAVYLACTLLIFRMRAPLVLILPF